MAFSANGNVKGPRSVTIVRGAGGVLVAESVGGGSAIVNLSWDELRQAMRMRTTATDRYSGRECDSVLVDCDIPG